jgi:Tfp pilus assembly protein PilV
LWIVLIALLIVGAMAGGISAIQDEYENTLESSYQSGSVTTDEIDVEVEPTPISADDAAEEAQPPVDSAKE